MPSWRVRPGAVLSGAVATASIAYPFAVYFGRDRVEPLIFVAVAFLLVVTRLLTLRGETARRWRVPMLAAAALLLLLALLDLGLAAKAYPVLLSLAAAGLFGWSLLRPPSLVERFARLRRPDLPAAAQRYCRRVTVIWVAWLLLNAAVAAGLALWGSVAWWTLWTGVAFYAVSALLLGGEYLVRRRTQQGGAGA